METRPARWLLCAVFLPVCLSATAIAAVPFRPFVLRAENFKHYADTFTEHDRETIVQAIPNSQAGAWMQQNEVNPLVPEGTWDYFCLDQVSYHGRTITILYDKTGNHYGRGAGLRVLCDGRQVAACDKLDRVTAPLPPSESTANAPETAAGWTKYEQNPVLGGQLGTCFDIALLKDGDVFRMWFSWRPKASLALVESKDGIHWSGPVIVLGPTKDTNWEKNRVTACQVVPHGGWHLMFYIGFSDVDHAQIGLARSKDGMTGWQRHPANPILRPGKDRWDHDAVYKPYALFDQGRWLLWYNGRRGGAEQIGLAIHAGEDVGF